MIRCFLALILFSIATLTVAAETETPIATADRRPIFSPQLTFRFDSTANFTTSINTLRTTLGSSRPTPSSPFLMNTSSNIDNAFTRLNITTPNEFSLHNRTFSLIIRNSDLYIMGFILSESTTEASPEHFFRFSDAHIGRTETGRPPWVDLVHPDIPNTRTHTLPFTSSYTNMPNGVMSVVINRENVFGAISRISQESPNTPEGRTRINNQARELLYRLAVSISESARFSPIQNVVNSSLYARLPSGEWNDYSNYSPNARDRGLINGYRDLSGFSLRENDARIQPQIYRLDDGTIVDRNTLSTLLTLGLLCINNRSGGRSIINAPRADIGCNMDDYYVLAQNGSWLSYFAGKGKQIWQIFSNNYPGSDAR